MSKKRTVTNAKDFNYFKECCESYIELFGLKGWKVEYLHSELDLEVYAQCYFAAEPRNATISLNTIWEPGISDEQLKKIALHEALHVFFGSYTSCAIDRFISEKEIFEKEHEMIQTLINVIMELTE